MENVKALVSKKFKSDYNKWEQYLAGLGYDNYCKVLNAKDYGIPQNRERIFIVSVLGDYDTFSFPLPFRLKLRLKDVLEDEVDDKYVLSDDTIEGFLKHNENHLVKGTGFLWEPKYLEVDGGGYANCLRANAALAPTDNTVREIRYSKLSESESTP